VTTEAFVRNIDQFINHESVDLVAFQKWQRKDDVTQKYLRRFGTNRKNSQHKNLTQLHHLAVNQGY
jgi:hypothetical protein